MKLFWTFFVCVVMVLFFIWLELQEEPKPIMIALPFTAVLVFLTARFGIIAPLIIFGVLIGAVLIVLLAAKRRKKL